MPLEEVFGCGIFAYAGAEGLPVWTGNDSWSAAAQVVCTAHSKQADLSIMLQIHMKSRYGMCVNYSYGSDSLFLVAILLNCLTSCHNPKYFPSCLLNLFKLCPMVPCMTVTQKLRNLYVPRRHCACLSRLLLIQIIWSKACFQVAFGKGCEEDATCRRFVLVECKWLLGLG